MSLTSPAIREMSVRADTEKLLAEWLASWFDGLSHTLGTNAAVVFPRVPIVFEGMPGTQPKSGGGAEASIEVSLFDLSKWERTEDWRANGIKEVSLHGPIVFQLRAAKLGAGEGRAVLRTVGDLLFALLNNPQSRGPLSEKGIQNLRPYMPMPVRASELIHLLICPADIGFNTGFTA